MLKEIRDIGTVVVSPMRRTMQTASLLFGQHPDLNKIKFIVHPDLRENLACSCDIPTRDFNEVVHEFIDCFP